MLRFKLVKAIFSLISELYDACGLFTIMDER